MPHVIVKLWPGKSDWQKRRLTETIVRGVTESGEASAFPVFGKPRRAAG